MFRWVVGPGCEQHDDGFVLGMLEPAVCDPSGSGALSLRRAWIRWNGACWLERQRLPGAFGYSPEVEAEERLLSATCSTDGGASVC